MSKNFLSQLLLDTPGNYTVWHYQIKNAATQMGAAINITTDVEVIVVDYCKYGKLKRGTVPTCVLELEVKSEDGTYIVNKIFVDHIENSAAML